MSKPKAILNRKVAARTLLGLMAVILGILLISAKSSGGKLTRKTAEALIRAKFRFPSNEQQIEFDLSWEGWCFKQRINPCRREAIDPMASALKSLGLVRVLFEGDTSRISLTEKGQQYALSQPTETTGETGGKFFVTRRVMVVASTVDFGAITGIQELPQFNSAKVEYTLIRRPTPFGQYPITNYSLAPIVASSIPKAVTLTKYDDGWRITDGD